jgi:hypothetical protein
MLSAVAQGTARDPGATAVVRASQRNRGLGQF